MFSAHDLNAVMRMDYPRHKIVDWSPVHDKLIEMNDFDRGIRSAYPEYEGIFLQYARAGVAFTGIGDGKIYGMFGAFEYWPGFSEAWLIPSRHLSKKTVTFHRAALKFFDLYCAKMETKRLQIVVHSQNVQAVRWAERCYFTHEGTLRKYGPDHCDYEIFARIK